jgi:penicillin amidase
LRWTALETDVIDLETFIAIDRARNWDEFRQALSLYNGPPQNFAYADTAGHIGHHSAGRIPVRKTGDGSVPYDGATDDGEWVGFIPLEDLPHVLDPSSGIIVAANNRIVGDDYRHHLTHNWRVPYRARRIHDLLKDRQGFTVNDFFAIQADTYSYPDAIFAAEIIKIGQPLVQQSIEWRELVDALRGWDGYSHAESRVLPLVTQMRAMFRRHILESLIGPELEKLFEWRNEASFIDRVIEERPFDLLPQGFSSYDSFILECYRDARASLAARLGPDPEQWTWGSLEPVRFPHPLEKLQSIGSLFAITTFPQNTGGSMPTVNAGSKVSMRFVVDLNDWGSTRVCLPLGESGELSSPHRDDQMMDWRQVTAPPLPFDDDAIAEACRNVFIMKPAPSKRVSLLASPDPC